MFEKIAKIFLAAMIFIALDMIFEANFPMINKICYYTGKFKKGKGITLLQISDLHGSASGKISKTILYEAEKIRPKAILLTGDLVDRHTKDFRGVYSLIGELYSICPEIYFVSGNHEWSNSGRMELLAELKALGVKLINNKGTVMSIEGADINICGVDDPYRGKDNIEKAMKAADSRKYTILLSHSPRIRDRLGGYDPDLILCGHTHGGQVRFPFIGSLIEPGEGLFPEFDKGSFMLKNGSILYIDSGVGTSKLPIRFLNRSQISSIRIKGNGQ